MTTKSNVVFNSALLTVAEAIGRLMRLILVMYSARVLGAEMYGKFAFALVFPLLFMILADLGIHQLLVREIARKTEDVEKYLGNALFIKFFLASFTLLMIFLTVNLTGKPQNELVVVYIMGIASIMGSFAELFKSVFQAFQKIVYDAVSILFTGLVTTVLGVVILTCKGGIFELAWAYLIASFLNLVYCILMVDRKFTRIRLGADLPLIKFLIKEGYPFGVSFFFSTLYAYIDTVMLSLMTRDAVVGYYNTAYRLIFAMGFIPATVMKAVYPALSKYYTESMKEFVLLFKRSFKTLFLLGFSIATLLYCLSDKIILLLYGEQYIKAASVLRILVWSTALIFITNVMTRTTRSSNRQHFSAKVVAFSAFFNVALNFLLIPRLEHVGAALATFLTEANTMVFHLVYLSRVLVKPPLFKLAPRVILINAVMAAYIFIVKDWNVFFVVVTAVAIHIGMVILTKYFSKEEVNFLKTMFKPVKANS